MVILTDSNDRTVLLLEALSKYYPLSSIKLYHILKEEYSYDGSYQSLYRSLQQLVDTKVLTKIEREYCINPGWVQQMKQKLENYDLSKNDKKNKVVLTKFNEPVVQKKAPLQTIEFTTVNDLRRYVKKLEEDYHGNTFAAFVKHSVFHLTDLAQEHRIHTNHQQRSIQRRIYCEGKTPLDQHAKSFYDGMGTQFILNNSRTFAQDAILFDAVLVQLYLHPDWVAYVERLHRVHKTPHDIDYGEFTANMRSTNFPSAVILNSNQDIVSMIREQTLSN